MNLTPRLVLAIAAAAALPWLFLNQQELIRWSDDPGRLWPLATVFTLLHHLVVLGLVLVLIRRLDPDRDPVHPFRGSHFLAFIVPIVLMTLMMPGLRTYARTIWFDPINPLQGDMLPLIQSALHSLWCDGANPYGFHDVADWSLALTFLPGFWLPYSAPYLAGIDLRLWPIAAFIGMTILALGDVAVRLRSSRTWGESLSALLPIVPCVALVYLESFHAFQPANHITGHLALLAVWAILLRGGAHLSAGIVFGVCLMARPYLVVLVPFYAAYLLLSAGRHAFWRTVGSVVFVGLLLGLPFLLTESGWFLYGPLRAYSDQLMHHFSASPWTVHGYGYSGLLHEAGLFGARMPIALAGLLGLFLLTVRRLATPTHLLVVSSAALLWFLSFALIPWFYVLFSPLVLIAFSRIERPLVPALPTFPRRALIVAIPLLFAAVFAALMAWVNHRPPLHHAGMLRGGGNELFGSIHAVDGLEPWGWWNPAGNEAVTFDEPVALLAFPLHDTDASLIGIQLHIDAPTSARVTLNQLPLGERPIDLDTDWHLWPLPPRALVRGMNTLRVETTTTGTITLHDIRTQ